MEDGDRCARVLCSKKALLPPPSAREPGVRWLIGSHRFLPRFTVVSSLRCLHALPHDPFSPDFAREADDLKVLLLKGFDVIGALYVCSGNWEENARNAIDASRKMGKLLLDDEGNYDMIGSIGDLVTGDVHFFASEATKLNYVEAFNTVVYEDNPEKYLWENGCLLRCELAFKLPLYVPATTTSDLEEAFSSMTATVATKFRDPQVVYLVEGSNATLDGISNSLVLHGEDLDFSKGNSCRMSIETSTNESSAEALLCSMFCKSNERVSPSKENAETIQITVLSNFSRNNSESTAPMAEYFPASEPARLVIVDFKLDVLSYAGKDFPVAAAVSKLIVPGLADQLNSMRKALIPYLPAQQPQLCAYHFLPQGILHPITVVYDVRYGETELKQVEVRKSLHSRLGLPLDRPLLLIANALTFHNKRINGSTSLRNASSLLKDVHTEIPSSGVSRGMISLVDGSYQYYHYLHDGFDDNGWGCAYRSLQTIISWFRLQNYTSIEVPSHREIQQVLVEIGDKEPSFVGSREWIGAIELSFVLDKLLGVTCRIINVRSGEELPEKCRELSMHFETQGTPIMIGGGVLAYTLLGVDFNEMTGDSAFLILDPHYTGSDDLKKIVSGGWCGWKKAVDSKGRSFFLKDKFYNLLLPQRPNMV